MAGSLHGMATRYLSTVKMEQQCQSRIQLFQYHIFIAMYSIAFYHIVTRIMVHGVSSLCVHLSWDLMSLVSWQNTPFMKYRPWAVDIQPENHVAYLEGWTILIPLVHLNPEWWGSWTMHKGKCRQRTLKVAQVFLALHQTILMSFHLDFYTSFLWPYHATQETYFASSLLPATNADHC